MVKMATPFQSFRTKITSEMVKIARYSTNTSHQISDYLASCITHHYVTNSNTYYNYNRNYPAVLQILPLVESSKFGNAIAALITIIISHFITRLAPCSVKEVEILRQERKYRGPIMMMVLFRISDILYWFLAEHILSLRWSLSLL
jgi:CPA2 family monovalent cation:H+ antiporter-2